MFIYQYQNVYICVYEFLMCIYEYENVYVCMYESLICMYEYQNVGEHPHTHGNDYLTCMYDYHGGGNEEGNECIVCVYLCVYL